jgi:cell division protein FtsX
VEVLKMTDHQEAIKNAVDAASVVTVVGTLMEVLPAIAALFTIVWTCIRIYETKTVQDWLTKNAKQE